MAIINLRPNAVYTSMHSIFVENKNTYIASYSDSFFINKKLIHFHNILIQLLLIQLCHCLDIMKILLAILHFNSTERVIIDKSVCMPSIHNGYQWRYIFPNLTDSYNILYVKICYISLIIFLFQASLNPTCFQKCNSQPHCIGLVALERDNVDQRKCTLVVKRIWVKTLGCIA